MEKETVVGTLFHKEPDSEGLPEALADSIDPSRVVLTKYGLFGLNTDGTIDSHISTSMAQGTELSEFQDEGSHEIELFVDERGRVYYQRETDRYKFSSNTYVAINLSNTSLETDEPETQILKVEESYRTVGRDVSVTERISRLFSDDYTDMSKVYVVRSVDSSTRAVVLTEDEVDTLFDEKRIRILRKLD